ncbi:glycogen synthase [Chloroflexus sp.]|uniref:glycogen synthase n=1 Tax=Chloroflexus sp. TaxID=1904827 RepID=UPI00298EEC45|nr:glycogen synthase [Chloroflexus sp.]MCS6887528.1 glycogen synthase [Chloroflexus sp.]MCX7859241.1 glycogen synthase [Chloroflexus sp.]MDW8403666.1 glycogen synthase [Chloroflexus sp.]
MPELRRVAIFTNEYPPYIYGGAGVHVEYLSQALSRIVPVEVRCFGDQRVDDPQLTVRGYPRWEEARQNTDPRFASAVDAVARSLAMAKDTLDASVVHCHTWYTDLAGLFASKLWGIPYVLTIHSLEPLRPWKVEQLGNAYHLSSWIERTAIEQANAVVAVSQETRNDILRLFNVDPARVHVIYNGIDLNEYRPTSATDALVRYGVDPNRPYVLFVGRITRQKGIIHLVNAIPQIDPAAQVVLCAGAPDTKEIGIEMEERVAAVSAQRPGVIWIREMLPRQDVIQFYSHAAVFCCPSVYEPFGIINLEAMACETAVVASAVGGIKEVVVPEETGLLVDPNLKPGSFDPVDPAAFSAELAAAINRLLADPALRTQFGKAGRRRVEQVFSWDAIAQQTAALYRSLLAE